VGGAGWGRGAKIAGDKSGRDASRFWRGDRSIVRSSEAGLANNNLIRYGSCARLAEGLGLGVGVGGEGTARAISVEPLPDVVYDSPILKCAGTCADTCAGTCVSCVSCATLRPRTRPIFSHYSGQIKLISFIPFLLLHPPPPSSWHQAWAEPRALNT
jgi:hypothetical protein